MVRRQPSPKGAVHAHTARIGQAVSSPCRLELLELLAQGPRTVEALAGQAGRTMATTSHHLQVLRRARLVEAEKAGLYVTYRLADPQVGAFLLALRRLAEARLAEVQQIARRYLGGPAGLEPVGAEELVRRVRAGEVTLVDVRPAEEYAAGHLPGAISMPLAEVADRAAELPRRREVVAYCRGPYCVMALDAVAVLRGQGFRAQRLEDGVLEWRARGWRLESGTARPARRRAEARK
jgi:rhodanese-related sulfurtransferase/DNA-binding transcriptional ArsR family regulator